MTDLGSAALGAALIAANVLAAWFLIERLRRPIRLAAAPIVAGALGPVVAVAAYLVVTRPVVNGATSAAVLAIAALVGGATTLRPESWPSVAGTGIRRPLAPLLLCAVAYLAGIATPTLLTTADGRALGALLTIASSGVAVGSTAALLVRTFPRRGAAERG